VRKLRDKLQDASEVEDLGWFSQRTQVHQWFSTSVRASTPQVAGGKGSDRSSSGETTGPTMPYSGDNVSFLSSLVGMVFEI
jgi:hypothetical protein